MDCPNCGEEASEIFTDTSEDIIEVTYECNVCGCSFMVPYIRGEAIVNDY